MQIISIDELHTGMYVVEVVETINKVKIKTKGWVKTDKSIAMLKRKGILKIAIDPSKTIIDEPNEQPEKAPEPTNKIKPVALENELHRAKKLYQEAKELQKKAIGDIQSGLKLDVEPIKEATKKFIDSIFRNQDALACMTRIREKDEYLLEHSLNVSILMGIFARHLALDTETINQLATGAFFHDIGKTKIPDEILHKPGKLSDAEFEFMKKHAQFSLDILHETEGLSDISKQVAAEHHEKLDGSGYPNNLKGDEISQWGRMITIVDIYDAMTAERVYKKGMTSTNAFKVMKSMTPHQLDEELLNSFIQCIGVYPVGTLVKLESGKLAIVTKSNKIAPLKPRIKVFYHTTHKHFTDMKEIDLARAGETESIESSVKPEQFKIDLNRFFRQAFVM
ncbi:HD-GYP domain-containing protein [Algibacillus agarilyticus]|uniref:HD-GYP domain-containing protein n=1 Tax=Algibacillus agarilyticus TaxID=2234133 RepID=UPI000DCF9255|nr:HD-GYP domain-containing protein [Algibacillus agarilyticus]